MLGTEKGEEGWTARHPEASKSLAVDAPVILQVSQPHMPQTMASHIESQSKPGVKMVFPEPCKALRRRPQLFMAGIVPY